MNNFLGPLNPDIAIQAAAVPERIEASQLEEKLKKEPNLNDSTKKRIDEVKERLGKFAGKGDLGAAELINKLNKAQIERDEKENEVKNLEKKNEQELKDITNAKELMEKQPAGIAKTNFEATLNKMAEDYINSHYARINTLATAMAPHNFVEEISVHAKQVDALQKKWGKEVGAKENKLSKDEKKKNEEEHEKFMKSLKEDLDHLSQREKGKKDYNDLKKDIIGRIDARIIILVNQDYSTKPKPEQSSIRYQSDPGTVWTNGVEHIQLLVSQVNELRTERGKLQDEPKPEPAKPTPEKPKENLSDDDKKKTFDPAIAAFKKDGSKAGLETAYKALSETKKESAITYIQAELKDYTVKDDKGALVLEKKAVGAGAGTTAPGVKPGETKEKTPLEQIIEFLKEILKALGVLQTQNDRLLTTSKLKSPSELLKKYGELSVSLAKIKEAVQKETDPKKKEELQKQQAQMEKEIAEIEATIGSLRRRLKDPKHKDDLEKRIAALFAKQQRDGRLQLPFTVGRVVLSPSGERIAYGMQIYGTDGALISGQFQGQFQMAIQSQDLPINIDHGTMWMPAISPNYYRQLPPTIVQQNLYNNSTTNNIQTNIYHQENIANANAPFSSATAKGGDTVQRQRAQQETVQVPIQAPTFNPPAQPSAAPSFTPPAAPPNKISAPPSTPHIPGGAPGSDNPNR
ncbi:hypothetical protein HYR82_02895 [Candidatus Peregrinibacteria bacterium]|nr:hypothetical protein [Candidatus Peregrinibacteria bacterium]